MGVFPPILTLLGVGLLILGYDYQSKGRASATWPSTQGLIVNVDYERTSAGRRTGPNYPLVTYRYAINGTTFVSTMRSFRDDGKSSDDIFRDYRRNQAVTVLTTCPKCGKTARSELPDLSPRSALFALRQAGALRDEQMKQLEREWTHHRKAHALDAYGKRLESRQSP